MPKRVAPLRLGALAFPITRCGFIREMHCVTDRRTARWPHHVRMQSVRQGCECFGKLSHVVGIVVQMRADAHSIHFQARSDIVSSQMTNQLLRIQLRMTEDEDAGLFRRWSHFTQQFRPTNGFLEFSANLQKTLLTNR